MVAVENLPKKAMINKMNRKCDFKKLLLFFLIACPVFANAENPNSFVLPYDSSLKLINDVCDLKPYLEELKRLSHNITRSQFDDLLDESISFYSYKKDKVYSKTQLLNLFKGDMSILFPNRETFQSFRDFISNDKYDCKSDRFMNTPGFSLNVDNPEDVKNRHPGGSVYFNITVQLYDDIEGYGIVEHTLIYYFAVVKGKVVLYDTLFAG